MPPKVPQLSAAIGRAISAAARGDFAKALGELAPVVREGDPQALNLLGMMTELGEGLPKNASKAVFLYRKAAAQGCSDAYLNLGMAYDSGSGVRKDYVKPSNGIDAGQRWAMRRRCTTLPRATQMVRGQGETPKKRLGGGGEVRRWASPEPNSHSVTLTITAWASEKIGRKQSNAIG
jgi:hypothetical protein